MACLVLWLLRKPILRAAGSYLVEDDGAHHADLALVLGGDIYGSRVLTAAKLVTEGYAPYVLISFPYRFGSCDSGKFYAEGKGYPAKMFVDLPSQTNSTRAEVKLLDGYFHGHNIRSILLITSSYHTHRAANLMRQQDPKLTVWAEPAPDPYFTADAWWTNREGQKTFMLEWAKTIATKLGD